MRRRRLYLLALLLGVGVLLLAVEPVRTSALRSVGRALVVDEPISRSDIIVISSPTNALGIFEAADLVAAGIAKTVAIFAEPADSVQGEFTRRGIPYPSGPDIARHQLALLGVPSVVEIPITVEGTGDQGTALRTWFDRQGFRSVVVMTVPDHSRRLRRVLDRAMKGRPIKVVVRTSRYSDLDFDRWWESREGIRTVLVESQKLLVDVLRHPLS